MPQTNTILIQLLDQDHPLELTVDKTSVDHVVAKLICHCRMTPVATSLFALRQGQVWLPPGEALESVIEKSVNPLQLRLRYKMPGWNNVGRTSKLLDIDEAAFLYFYQQVRNDFDQGLVCNKKMCTEKEHRWWVPITNPGHKDKKEEKLYDINKNVMDLVRFNMAIDVLDGVPRKEVTNNVKAYIPKDLWTGFEKLMGVAMLKSRVESSVDKLLKICNRSINLKDLFLKYTELYFPSYFEESFEAQQISQGGDRTGPEIVKLIVQTPKEDQEVQLMCLEMVEKKEERKVLATIGQICNIALKDGENIEISRKNGIPVYYRLSSLNETFSFLSLLCGYFRLCEKWTFSLCTEIKFPVLEDLTNNKVHGPVTRSFAEEKLEKRSLRKGSYLLRQSTQHHDKVFLNFCTKEGKKPEEILIYCPVNQLTLNLSEASEKINTDDEPSGYILEKTAASCSLPLVLQKPFETINDLIHMLKNTSSHIELTDCLHPSEFDKADSLLLCRTDKQLKEDRLGNKPTEETMKKFIPFHTLSRYEMTLLYGRMTKVWKGEWRCNKLERKTVALKQLNKEVMVEKMADFLQLCYQAMLWNDGSLVTVFGCCLPWEGEPAALITEYFSLGTLRQYLREKKSIIQPVDLVEAATSLARALFHLEDIGLAHGQIRCKNMFVESHTDNTFKVKLGEGSLLSPFASAEDVHWLDFDQLQALQKGGIFIHSAAGDVWSFGTTLWEIFSYGESPLPNVSTNEAINFYLDGYRLKWPGMGQLSHVYSLMKECWNPIPGIRKQPQAIMRDMNQLLYKVFNSRRDHTYMTIDNNYPKSTTPAMTPSSSAETLRANSLPGSIDTNESQYVPSSGTSCCESEIFNTPSNCTHGLVPIFTELSRKFLEAASLTNSFPFNSPFGSSSPLIDASRSGSSLSGSLFNTDMSVLTGQTSVDWSSSCGGFYSVSSIYQFDDEQVEYNTNYPLGEGNFGIVYKGARSKSDGTWEEVAVKMIKDSEDMTQEMIDNMELEVDLMKRLSHHNIVKIQGVMNPKGTTIIVMEFIQEGSLDRYLHVNQATIDYPRQLFGYAQNIADGMDYLVQNSIIHRDLAARNILVADHETVKISDFGLARVANDDFYVMKSATNIPVKWLALECLTHRKYSHASDVWSFGVTLWEMFALGRSPALTGCEDFFQHFRGEERLRLDFKDWLELLESGVRLPQTSMCPSQLYSQVMLQCWDKESSKRPTFRKLKELLKGIELFVT